LRIELAADPQWQAARRDLRVVGLLLGAVLEPNPQNRVWSFFTKAGVLLFAGIGFMIVALVSMFIAGLLGVPGW
jgi:hypothetical protein